MLVSKSKIFLIAASIGIITIVACKKRVPTAEEVIIRNYDLMIESIDPDFEDLPEADTGEDL